jgi:hypothetical protein
VLFVLLFGNKYVIGFTNAFPLDEVHFVKASENAGEFGFATGALTRFL